MSEQFNALKTRYLIILLVELVLVALFQALIPQYLTILQYCLLLVNIGLILYMMYRSYQSNKQRLLTVTQVLGTDAEAAIDFGGIFILTYDDNHIITWVSDAALSEAEIIGESLEQIYPEVISLVSGKEEIIYFREADQTFEVTSMNKAGVLFFKDTSELYDLMEQNRNNQVVLGIAHLDNYDEATQYEEEQTIAYIDSNIRQAVVHWADEYEMYIRRLRPDRYLMVLNEKSFAKVDGDRFSILHTVRKQAAKIDTNITLSLAFARNSDNLKELEDMSNRALELAQGRGGDQVVINTKHEQIRYYGGSSEAIEKRSRVRIRIVAQSLEEYISKASNVLIVGHKMMDFDCFASALALSLIASSYKDDVSIVMEYGDCEAHLTSVLDREQENLEKRHHFINRSQADSIINDDSLLIMVDHHNLSQTQFEDLPELINNVVIVDHHRRSGEFDFKPLLAYIEPSASSASELVVELLPFQKQTIHINQLEATLLYTGMLVDTNRFRNRTGSRTFEAASELRKFGADLEEADNMLRDVYENFELKNRILSKSELYDDYCVIVPYKDGEVSRTMMSQVADEILQVRDVEASFVVAFVSDATVAISARSKGDLNVQVIMERLGGGGHFTGAAAQIRDKSLNEVVDMLKDAITEVREELE